MCCGVNKEHGQDGIGCTVGPAVNTSTTVFPSKHKDTYDS